MQAGSGGWHSDGGPYPENEPGFAEDDDAALAFDGDVPRQRVFMVKCRVSEGSHNFAREFCRKQSMPRDYTVLLDDVLEAIANVQEFVGTMTRQEFEAD
jgi:hypothetical protein